MEAKGRPLRFLCDEQILEIPFFQRAYVWNEDNWKELLDDLLETKGSHFLGSIILKRSRIRTGEADKAIVIDGQQRLTTLSILIKVLYDCIQHKTSKLSSDARDALFYTLRSSDSNYQISIKHSNNDYKSFESVIGNVNDSEILSPILNNIDDINEKSHLIKRCYKFFYEQLKNKDQDTIIDLWDSLFDKSNNILVVIDLEEGDQEQKIFDTINSSGIRLTATDIIKNALYQHLIEINGDREEIAKYYKETWEKTFECDNDTASYWNKEKTTGRLKRQNSELLLQSIAIIKKIFDYDNKEHTFAKLPDLYKDYVTKLDEQQTKEFIFEIIDYANIYHKHILDFNNKETFEYNNDDLDEVEKRVTHILDKNDISTFNPYILSIYKKYNGNNGKIIECLRDIERFVMRSLISKSSTKNFNKDCILFIEDTTGNAVKQRIEKISDSDLKKGISEKVSNKLGTIILFWIELYRRIDKNYDTKSLQYNFTLEHIMPQKWEMKWKDVPYVDENGNILPNNELSVEKRYAKVYSLGNMTLLNGCLNTSVSNNNFETKMKGDGKKKGVEKYASLSVTKDDIVDNIFHKGKVWNEQTIISREKALGDEIINLW